MFREESMPHALSEAAIKRLKRPGVSASPGASALCARSTSTAPGGAAGSVEGARITRAAVDSTAAGSTARLRGGATPPLAAAATAKKAVPGLLEVGASEHTRVPAEALRNTVHPGVPGMMATLGAAGTATPMDTLKRMR